jgi:putative DNA primase/helicase
LVPINPPFTDVGNAQRLVAKHGNDIRYCPPWKKWLIWDGKRWLVDKTLQIEQRAKETVRELLREAAKTKDSGKSASLAKHALRSEYSQRIQAMVNLAASEPGIAIMPEELDADPMLLNCRNGTLDLRTGKLRTHNRDDLITKLVPVNYLPTAKCPIFEAFINKIMGGDMELVKYLQRAIGYALTGEVTEKAMFFLYGDGNNGKTTLLEAVRAVLGDYAGQVPIDSLMMRRNDSVSNDIARLAGERFVTSSEAEQGKKLAEAKVKQITGMGKLQARFLYGEYFEFTPTFKIFMDANHKPEIRGTDQAIWNRMKLIPFDVAIPAEEIDKDLLKKLKMELPGILAWAVRGCMEWQRSGLGEPTAIKEATQGYREEMDTLAHFIEDECILGPYDIPAKVLHEAYKDWCKGQDEEPASQKQLGVALKAKGLKGIKTGGQRGWRGITLRKSVGSLFENLQ